MEHVIDHSRPDLGGNARHGDIHTWSPRLWRFMLECYGIGSVLDVGCGEGHAVKFFHRLGLVAHGIDGLRLNVERAVTPIALHDLLAGPYVMPVDLAWSCEVAEHIEADRVDHYLDTLANGRIIAMTHAVPGQDGHHHVNCQPAEYWIGKLESRGYALSTDSGDLREIAKREEVFTYFAATGLLFTRR
ncbi:MAG TPA: class I SAM-dependent methyltransferase [Acetobacteraceae bacterium]|nr:class I SAM-dependent methyltransferase [Acetobacteraceae bacterium]